MKIEGGVVSLTGQDKLRIKMRIILIDPGQAVYVSGGCDQADGWIV